MEPVIEFDAYEIINLEYKNVENQRIEELENESSNIQRTIKIGLSEDVTFGAVKLHISVVDNENNREINLEILGKFIINGELSKDEASLYLGTNGVAILYPYARSIISFISTLDSENAIVLPTINTSDNEPVEEKP
ncbi:hypothetical protein AE205_14365 [Listeria monocytogenes]|uniref:Preprotein translocase subunit SecB n=1 Tax=Listeria monocytogenes TaxID=1639 RepID=A0A9P1ZGB4_LISMN|nr:protein-export chaperone SecB [Listeria monocytogenes]EAH4404459.1 hypothetical protein [Listeria monocytogenes serotype 1/2b]AGR09932.1 hypothetical protein M639_11190 [Listeria monocytogenes]EAA0173053.1 hypothetical protein [Listeria monocytogenes]EAA0214917.1 hypothetical protein [Listeria monocytogenes]EAC2392794.1 hypothetical protein [Listeria monocytogenes]